MSVTLEHHGCFTCCRTFTRDFTGTFTLNIKVPVNTLLHTHTQTHELVQCSYSHCLLTPLHSSFLKHTKFLLSGFLLVLKSNYLEGGSDEGMEGWMLSFFPGNWTKSQENVKPKLLTHSLLLDSDIILIYRHSTDIILT